MLPRGMHIADLSRKRKRRRNKRRSDGRRRTDNDPLQTFDDGGVDLDDVAAKEDADDFADFFDDGGEDKSTSKRQTSNGESDKVFASTRDGTGSSTSGRSAWKEKHKKGKYSGKRRKSEPPRRRIGI
jgi:hypothetical protein